MANRYGQTDVLAQYLAAQPKQHHTGLGTALRLGGAGLAAYGQHQKQKQQKSALAAALGQILPASAEVQGMAADPLAGGGAQTQATNPQAESLATMLSNPATAPLAQAMLGKALNPPKPEAFTLKPGEQRFRDGEVIAQVPAVPKPPKELSPRDAAFAALTPEQQRQVLLKPAVSVNNPASVLETEEAKAFGKQLVSTFGTIQESANAARSQRGFIDQARTLADDNLHGALKQKAGNVLVAMGINADSIPGFESISNGQQFNGVIQNAVLAKMQAQKGPQTENDAARIQKTVASLGNTPEARNFLLDSAAAMAEMDILREQHWRQHREKTGSFKGAASAWDSGIGGKRLVGRNTKSGRVVFLPQFVEDVARENPDASIEQILELWDSYE